MDATELSLLALGGLAAGIINTLAGGGSLITVGLLVFFGLPGTIANGTNRIGVLVQNLTSIWSFGAAGFSGFKDARPILAPMLTGSLLGAFAISRVTPEVFEQIFGVVMLALLVPMLRTTRGSAPDREPPKPWSPPLRALIFFGIGLYGGAIQAGMGIFVIFALARSGYDLVRANSVKVVMIGALTVVAVPVFIASRQVDWPAAAALVAGMALGGVVGARIAVIGGERIIKPVLGVAVIALSGRMLGLY